MFIAKYIDQLSRIKENDENFVVTAEDLDKIWPQLTYTAKSIEETRTKNTADQKYPYELQAVLAAYREFSSEGNVTKSRRDIAGWFADAGFYFEKADIRR